MRRGRWIALFVLSFAPASARAQTHDPVAAEALFKAGRALVVAGDYANACPKFAESQQLDPAAGTLINLADCHEHVGKLAAAWEEWQEAIDLLAASDDRLPESKKRFARLDARVPRLVVHLVGVAVNAHVVRDGVDLGGAFDVPLPMDPGAHAIRVTDPQHHDASFDVTLVEGETKKIDAPLGAWRIEDPIAPPPKKIVEPDVTPSNDGAKRRKIAWIVGGAGVVVLGVGVVGGLVALHDKSVVDRECPSNLCTQNGYDAARSGHTWATISTVGTIAGGAMIVTSLVLWISAPNAPPPKSTATIAPVAGGATFVWTRSF